MFLQLLGAWTVWHDLTGSARAFGKGVSLKSTWRWLKAAVFGQDITLQIDSAHHTTTAGRVRVIQRRPVSPIAPMDSRVEALEYNLAKVDEGLSAAYREIEEAADRLRQALGEESKKREEAHKQLEERLKDSIVGNYTVLAFGALWVVVGIVLSALAPEIAKTVAGQWVQVWEAM
jgi:hypothetical protein